MTHTNRYTQKQVNTGHLTSKAVSCYSHLNLEAHNQRRNFYLDSLLLVVTCFILAGCGPAPKEKPPQLQFKIDHYKFYDFKTLSTVADVPVKLKDQFHEQQPFDAKVTVPQFFGNPVIKTKKGDYPGEMKNPMAHLTWYKLEETPSEPRRMLELSNQFGTQTVTIGSASVLLAPALKSEKGKDIDKDSKLPNTISHYVGYLILNKIKPFRGPLKLQDQFHTDPKASIRQAAYLFVPADKIRDGEYTERVHAEDHLVAFQLSGKRAPDNTIRRTKDQFNSLRVDFQNPVFLAVPTKKKVLN